MRGRLSPVLLRDDLDVVHHDGYLGVARHVWLVARVSPAHASVVETVCRIGLVVVGAGGASRLLDLVSADDPGHPGT